MPTTTPSGNVRVPTMGDEPDIPADMMNMATDLEGMVVDLDTKWMAGYFDGSSNADGVCSIPGMPIVVRYAVGTPRYEPIIAPWGADFYPTHVHDAANNEIRFLLITRATGAIARNQRILFDWIATG